MYDYRYLKILYKYTGDFDAKNTWAYKNGYKSPELPGFFENRQTRVGIDKDKNGIRDDVDFIIYRRATSYIHFMMLNQLARGKNVFLLAENYYDPIFRHGHKYMRSLNCLESVTKDNKNLDLEDGFISSATINNFIRAKHLETKIFQGGNSFTEATSENKSVWKKHCDFDIRD